MNTMFKEGHLQIMRLFYEKKGVSLHLREIARRSKMQVRSATRYLNQLEEQGVLRSISDGNLRKFSVKPGDRAFLYFTHFDSERFLQLPRIRQKAIRYFLDKIPEQPLFVYLFGSTATGTFRKDSDIDLLLVTNGRIQPEKGEHEAEALTALYIQTFQMDFRDFLKELRLKEEYVIQSALETGYPLTNHLGFYRVYFRGSLGQTASGPFVPEPAASIL